ncbi:MAG TPA: HEAT repeat domain-containing protein [Niabella sp.]|nr:HEAT repeat domain-containing protein [Niabella sp.]
MKNSLLILILLYFVYGLKAQNIIKPSISTKTTFAIIIDDTSFSKTKNDVLAYKSVIEKDNLGTYIIYHKWKSADEIRNLLLKLYNDKKAPLEGAVFIGTIPIPMIRDAQHLCSAFKMDQDKYPWRQSSVASDRFYDDFNLKFEFLKRDEKNPELFYYSLSSDGAQKINSSIYSARIKPYGNKNIDKYKQLSNYLKKVVNERTKNRKNIVDNITMGRGNGYNSESKVAWAGEQIALKEQFPYAFSSAGNIKFIDYNSQWPIKKFFLTEVQRPELDIMIFHHHGAFNKQYLNGLKEGSDPNTSIENLKLYIRSKVKSTFENGKSKDEAIDYYVSNLNIPRSWAEEAFDLKKVEEDSLLNLSLDISIEDIGKIRPGARFIMFDACYNGSFYENENVAGAYLFNDGNTIVAQGNTVNVIQDKWPDEFLGLLTSGLRIGAWNQLINFLETHLIGDPTFHFAKNDNLNFDINTTIKLKSNDNSFWLHLLNNNHADIQSLALRKLFQNNYSDISNLLRKTYLESHKIVVRAEAFFLLSKLNDKNFIEVLKLASKDSYELIRRFAIEYICKSGSYELIPSFASSMFFDNTSERILFKQKSLMKLLDLEKLKAEVNRQAALLSFYDKKDIENILFSIDNNIASYTKTMQIISGKDSTIKVKNKQFEIRSFRNNPITRSIPELLKLATDHTNDISIRLYTIEALGWYNYSYQKNRIIEGLTPLTLNKSENKLIINEAIKTIKRLN